MKQMEDEKNVKKVKGCIKTSRGPWTVQRMTKKKGVMTSLRFPTEKEREKNKERERRRREITRRIYAGLRNHGNYNMSKYSDNNDLLKALCYEAGWFVQQDGQLISRKNGVREKGEAKSTMSEEYLNLTLSLSLPTST